MSGTPRPIDLNRRLAALLGWTGIIETGGALLGTPPAGHPECRGQAKVPDWSGDWRDCGPLIGEYRVMVEQETLYVEARARIGICGGLHQEVVTRFARDVLTRRAIVCAVIAVLEISL